MQFLKKSLKGQAFDTLSTVAQFQVRFDESSTDEEKFMVCIQFAVTLQQYINFGNAEEKTIFNHSIIMGKIKNYLNSGTHPDVMVGGYPALYHALTYPQLVGLLLASGANPDILYSNRKRTVLHLATIIIDSPYYFTDNLFLTAEILAAYGADLELQDSEGIKAFDFIKGLLLSDKSLLSAIQARFKQVTEKPREIALLNKLYQPVSSTGFLVLTQTDLERIALYQQGKFTELLETDGLYQFITRMRLGLFGTHELSQSAHYNGRVHRGTSNKLRHSSPPYQLDRYFWLTKSDHEQKLPGRCRAVAGKIIEDAMTQCDAQPGQVSALITQSSIFTMPSKEDKKPMDIEDDFVILSSDKTETIDVETTKKEQKRGCTIN